MMTPVVALAIRPEALEWGSAGTGGTVRRQALFARLAGAGRVTELSAPPGSGKTVLLRSWVAEAGLQGRVAWVTVQPGECGPERFWTSLAEALRETAWGAPLVRPLSAAPALDGYAVVEHLLEDLGHMGERAWLVVDDLHELRSTETLHQLELFVASAPSGLRFVLSTRHDLRLGLHRLRLEGELTELRARDLRFDLAEARQMFERAGAYVPDAALGTLVEKTEGWAAGLRLAALSLTGHPDPLGFAAGFSGSERTVAEYLLAEVLERQPENVRRLLLRTSLLDRVNGELADLLAAGAGGERVLQELEEAGAFVTSLDAGRSWFRYHQLFADLLRLELRRAQPAEIQHVHSLAAWWFSEHGHPVEAVRHALASADWTLAARLLSDHWCAVELDGRGAAARELLTGFPAQALVMDPELLALRAAAQLVTGSLEEAEADLALAEEKAASVPEERLHHFQLLLTMTRLSLAHRHGNLMATVEEARHFLDPAEASAFNGHAGGEARAVALVSLGSAEVWAARAEEAEQHLSRGAAIAVRAGHPYLELAAVSHWAMAATARSLPAGAERGLHALALAERHGWGNEQPVGVAYLALALTSSWQGRLDDAEKWLSHAECALRPELDPPAGLTLYQAQGLLDVAKGHHKSAVAALEDPQHLSALLAAPHPMTTRTHALLLLALARAGEAERAKEALAALSNIERESAQVLTAVAALHCAKGDWGAALASLAPVLDGRAPLTAAVTGPWLVQAFLLEALARDELGERAASIDALERSLDIAEPDGALLPYLLHPAPDLLEQQRRRRTSHASLVSEILTLLKGATWRTREDRVKLQIEPLSESEARVLRYLPTNLSAPEIANDLYLSVNTVKTHLRHVYAKLGVNSRTDAVERARALGLLAPASH